MRGLVLAVVLCAAPAAAQETEKPAAGAIFYGSASSPISGGVIIPPGATLVWTSGTVPAARPGSKPEDPARFGDTRAQALSVLRSIEDQLVKQGLTMKDVVYVRAYLVADPTKGGTIDMDGWSAAYKEYFGTEKNPTKPARSTVGVAALVNPLWLIEIEAFAAATR